VPADTIIYDTLLISEVAKIGANNRSKLSILADRLSPSATYCGKTCNEQESQETIAN
jgi:hypothetical protein